MQVLSFSFFLFAQKIEQTSQSTSQVNYRSVSQPVACEPLVVHKVMSGGMRGTPGHPPPDSKIDNMMQQQW